MLQTITANILDRLFLFILNLIFGMILLGDRYVRAMRKFKVCVMMSHTQQTLGLASLIIEKYKLKDKKINQILQKS